MRPIDEALRPHPMLVRCTGENGAAGRRILELKDEREHAVLNALVEHCGGLDLARPRVVVRDGSWMPFEGRQWASSALYFAGVSPDCELAIEQDEHGIYTQVLLDGALAWVGGYGPPGLRWRERFAPGCPDSVADAVPDPR